MILLSIAGRRSEQSSLGKHDFYMCRREAHLTRTATRLQARRRGLTQARRYRAMRCGAVALQAAWRGMAGRRAFLRHKAAVLCIQARWRGLLALRACEAARVSFL